MTSIPHSWMRLGMATVGFAAFAACADPGAAVTPVDSGTQDAPTQSTDAATDAPSSSREARLAAARVTWAKAKPDCPAYHYMRYHLSFTGWEATTTIEIVNDRPARRS
jgi:hypothetical protein